MSAFEGSNNGILIGRYRNGQNKLSKDLRKHIKRNATFFCIGTDRSTGDCFAPLVGTKLKELGYNNVIGTLNHPVHAMNLDDRIAEIPKNTDVIALDAALGNLELIGSINLRRGKLKPGAALGKHLTSVGDYSLTGVVNISGYEEHVILQNTRLAEVMKLVDETVEAIQQAFPLKRSNNKFLLKLKRRLNA
ncbi:spore protease YyaC [Oceanobacillus kimchii]|uniref:Spore protease YyaC n=1 Tax=Oceanobacillus kimchii TaxID=746691 RepID=A0ABQ5TIC7_9BACI|nr:spore protease YyaC [Oceanobacillus kimchii]GLO66215.1 hypothetical protein MACH08_19990 [Oceanobacillus kimchii]